MSYGIKLLQVVTTSSESRIALSSVPLPCSSFLHLPDWPDHVEDFMTKGEFSCLIVLGLVLADQTVTRDLLVGGKADSIVEAVRDALEQSADPALNLQVEESQFSSVSKTRSHKRFLRAVQLEFLDLDITLKETPRPLANR